MNISGHAAVVTGAGSGMGAETARFLAAQGAKVALLDLDDFKNVNDTKGHLFGDEVLNKLATILNAISREEDIPCRYGGEEFVVILPETNVDGAINFAARLRSEMQADAFFREHRITWSGGIAAFPEAGDSSSTLLESADKALYQAKFSGKDCCIVQRERPV